MLNALTEAVNTIRAAGQDIARVRAAGVDVWTATPPAPAIVSAGTWSGVANSAALSVDAPTGSGDVDLIFVYVYSTSQSATPVTSGLTGLPGNPFATSGTNFGNDLRWYVFRSLPQAGPYQFSISGGGRMRFGFAIRIANVDPDDLFDGTPVTSSTDATTTAPVALTTTGTDRLLLWASFNLGDSASHTVPTGFTEISGSADSSTASPTNGGNYMLAAKLQPAAGATGNVSGTWDNTNNVGAWLAALKPAA